MKTPKLTQEDKEQLSLAKLAHEYSDEGNARKFLESLLWPDGPTCPHCRSKSPYVIVAKKTSKSPSRPGLYKCSSKPCLKQFSVTVGTIFEGSKIPLGKWLMAFFILGSSKKGVSAHQMHRMIGVTYKTSWFMCHRIRHAMTLKGSVKLSGTVEMDAGYIGGAPTKKRSERAKWSTKTPVVALVERGGDVRPKVVANVTYKNLRQFVGQNLERGSVVNTDQFAMFHTLLGLTNPDGKHVTVNHKEKEYIRKESDGSVAHVLTAESFFSLLKRGMMGAFHHVSPEHLPRYCEEFAFRWNTREVTDGERFVAAIQASEGKRLKYQNTISA